MSCLFGSMTITDHMFGFLHTAVPKLTTIPTIAVPPGFHLQFLGLLQTKKLDCRGLFFFALLCLFRSTYIIYIYIHYIFLCILYENVIEFFFFNDKVLAVEFFFSDQ